MSSTNTQPALQQRRDKALGKGYRLFYQEPAHIVRGEGAWLFDEQGQRYLDLYNNVAHVGHCHPRVVAAICNQAGLLNTHTRYLHENVVAYAERLLALFPAALDTAMFCCTGSEANELALRMARHATGAEGVVVTNFAYHGNTHAIHQISTSDIAPAERPAHVATIPMPDAFRGRYTGPEAGKRYAATVESAIAQLRERGIKPAAFIIDTIASSGGVISMPPGFLSGAAAAIRNAGGLFIADEVQPGFGRMGRTHWGFEADGVVPDIVTLGKPMGNGHPLSGVIAPRAITDAFGNQGRYFNTFGGNPVSAAAGLAVLDVLEEEQLQANALSVGAHLIEKLRDLATRYEQVGDVRGSGLFIGLEMTEPTEQKTPATALAKQLVEQLKHSGVLTGVIGPDANILKLRSPKCLSHADADFFLERLEDSLATVVSQQR